LLLDVCVFKVRFVSHFVCGTERLLSLWHRALWTVLDIQSVPRSKLRLGYNIQADNVVQWNNRCLFWDPQKTHKYSPYRAVNTLRLSYTNQSVNAVQWNHRCFFWHPHKTHKYTLLAERRIVEC
jgi:hypothetical protein